jgi:hypothetical protein
MESFEYMEWKGAIDMVNPDVVLTYFEECKLVFFFFTVC